MDPNSSWMDIPGSIDRPLQTVINVADLPRYRQAAKVTNISLRTITQPGEMYYLVGGGSYMLDEDKIAVAIGGSDLSGFWQIVREIEL